MAKKRAGRTRRSEELGLPRLTKRFMESQRILRNEEKKAEELRKKREKRNEHRAWIQSGKDVGFTVKQILWLRKSFPENEQEEGIWHA